MSGDNTSGATGVCEHDWKYTHTVNAGRYSYHRHCPLCRAVEKMY